MGRGGLAGALLMAFAVAWSIASVWAAGAAGAPTPGTTGAAPVAATTRVLDDFESIAAWSTHPAEGVRVKLSSDEGVHGRALRVDFDFERGSGYAVIRRALDLDLPDNYAFDFSIRGACRPNDLEFKLVDASGENVWWHNRRGFEFPTTWKTLHSRRRQIEFAWGPAGGGMIRHAAALEIAITAGQGGKGTVWLDDLAIRALTPDEPAVPRTARASSARPGRGAARAIDADTASTWSSAPGDALPWLELDFGAAREFEGLVVSWAPGRHPADYVVELSLDGARWDIARVVREGDGGRDHLWLPESEASRVRFRALRGVPRLGCAISNVAIEPLASAASLERFFAAEAYDAAPGDYPRGVSNQMSYWTVIGVDGGVQEALVGEDGAIEAGKGGFSVEPFLHADGNLWTWADVRAEQSLERGYLPIPTVRWPAGALELSVTAVASGSRDSSLVYARYQVRNPSREPRNATLFLAVRPFQVNPPSQFLNARGGTSRIREIERVGSVVRVNRVRGVVSLSPPDGFGATTFDQGNIVGLLRRLALPPRVSARDSFGFASAALSYRLALPPGGEREVDLVIPLDGPPRPGPALASDDQVRALVARELEACRRGWAARLAGVDIKLPVSAAAITRTLDAQLAYILVNRDGAAIQPGSRSYERSWIRDGALTSSALLRLGHTEDVRQFLEWFAANQYDNGKVPCCVDRRGPDPVPEHDSSGEFIFLVAEYLRLGGERAVVERLWPRVRAAAAYLDSLRQLGRTSEYRAAGKRRFYGLLPPSISHEGYSAKPMHSYWDDLFALRGFKDAAEIATALGKAGESTTLARTANEFARDLNASIRASMAAHKIDYMPGCADLGDFDATSTTIALSPVQATGTVPPDALRHTFERYWEFFVDRRGGAPWEAYTPYEIRNIGAFVRLGWRERANELLAFFIADRRPPGWAQWAEVVWQDARTPRFIGDMPHTWVGSDFIRSVLDMLAYERESDDALVLAAGVPESWVREDEGLRVSDLVTRYGRLAFSLRADGAALEAHVDGVRVPRGGIVLAAPGVGRGWKATVNGVVTPVSATGEVIVRKMPANVRIEKR